MIRCYRALLCCVSSHPPVSRMESHAFRDLHPPIIQTHHIIAVVGDARFHKSISYHIGDYSVHLAVHYTEMFACM